MSRIQSIAPGAVIAIVAVAAGMLLSRTLLSRTAAPSGPVLANGTLLTPPRPLPPLAFVDHEGQSFGADRLQGRWSLLFFGFTNCPEVCPATLGILAQAEKLLADLPPPLRPQIVLASVDPQRDTPEQLSTYVRFFSPSLVGVTAPQATIDEFTRKMAVSVAITQLGEGGYTVDHSASVFAINPNGAMRALFTAPHTPDGLASDFRRLTQTPSHG